MALVDETALRRPIGGVEVMRDQLLDLLHQAALPSVCLQVVPVSLGVHEGLSGSFSVLEFAEPDEPVIVYLENAVNAAHVNKDAEVRGYKLVFDRLRSAALSPSDTVTLLERLVGDL